MDWIRFDQDFQETVYWIGFGRMTVSPCISCGA